MAAEPASLNTDERNKYDPIRIEGLPKEERQILRAAIEDGEHFECKTGSEAFESFADRCYDQYERNHKEHGVEVVYAADGDSWYKLSVRRQDQAFP